MDLLKGTKLLILTKQKDKKAAASIAKRTILCIIRSIDTHQALRGILIDYSWYVVLKICSCISVSTIFKFIIYASHVFF